jgi:hypothetical protein
MQNYDLLVLAVVQVFLLLMPLCKMDLNAH